MLFGLLLTEESKRDDAFGIFRQKFCSLLLISLLQVMCGLYCFFCRPKMQPQSRGQADACDKQSRRQAPPDATGGHSSLPSQQGGHWQADQPIGDENHRSRHAGDVQTAQHRRRRDLQAVEQLENPDDDQQRDR